MILGLDDDMELPSPDTATEDAIRAAAKEKADGPLDAADCSTPYCGMCGCKLSASQEDGDYCDDCWKIVDAEESNSEPSRDGASAAETVRDGGPEPGK